MSRPASQNNKQSSSKPPTKKIKAPESISGGTKRNLPSSTTDGEDYVELLVSPSLGKTDIAQLIEDTITSSLTKLRNDLTALVMANHQSQTEAINALAGDVKTNSDTIEALKLDNETLLSRVGQLKSEVSLLKRDLADVKRSAYQTELRCNATEQWTRKSAVRVFGIPQSNPREDCRQLVHDVVTDKLKLDLDPHAVEVAHRVGKPRDGKPAPIIAKFARRDVRDLVLRARKALKGTRISIKEDLTKDNQKLLHDLSTHEEISAAWSWNGKIFGKLVSNNRTLNFTLGDNIDLRIQESSEDSSPRHRHSPPVRGRGRGRGTWAPSPDGR